jgi:transposase
MFYIGVDIAKSFNVAYIVDEKDKVIKSSFKFKNDEKGFEEFLYLLSSIDTDTSNFIIGMEATGLLFENLYLCLKGKEYNVILLNPYQTNKFREFDTMKNVKNDNIDAMMIAALLKSGRYSKAHVSEEVYANIKALYRHKESLQDELKKHKRQVLTLLAVVFPEMEQVVKDPFNVTGLALLEKYPTAKHYDYASVDRILKTFRGIKGNNFNEQKAKKLLELAKSSIYQGNGADERAYVIRSHIRIIKLLNEELNEIENEMLKLFSQAPVLERDEEQEIMNIIDNLRTIPGVSDKTIFALMSECGDLSRFSSQRKFIGYLGLYPTLEQSGNTTTFGHLAKRGAKLAKKALYQAAIAAIRHNDELNKLYRDKVSQGRAKKEAVIIVARKLAGIILAIYKNNVAYNPNRVFTPKKVS